jgi:hypothetical protein
MAGLTQNIAAALNETNIGAGFIFLAERAVHLARCAL